MQQFVSSFAAKKGELEDRPFLSEDLIMAAETKKKSNPLHDPVTSFIGDTVYISDNRRGALPLDCAEVFEREITRQEKLVKRLGEANRPSEKQ